jgi:hypothetical protein
MQFNATQGLNGNWPHYEGKSRFNSKVKTFDEPGLDFSYCEDTGYISKPTRRKDLVTVFGVTGGIRYQNTVADSINYLSRWMKAIYG